ncbi:hypothetical protein [Spirosoma sp. KUDC1026]|uniref:hypothetical protein n=1 Tax=Spirosoma sp. KUDC1026 TaxID=2745947 RepID=UPI00159BBC17|nr:hypothetical protein [Spirosoma sp. KUDC1026]QKZ14234.1 hypothetical protein HU175_17005 [Spirosoma sp. KUDC1026]
MKKTTILTVSLTTQQIDSSLEKAKVGLAKYLNIQKRLNDLAGKPLKDDADFRKSFNGFYRIRQKPAAWYDTFYELLDESRNQSVDFSTILRSLHIATDRYEASFASKLLATLNPQMPVIDSIVLKNLNAKLPYQSDPNRFNNICSLHEEINRCYKEYLQSENGRYLVKQFQKTYPNVDVTEIKMLDLVLWQSR